jgi:hypothetical protein
LLAVAVGCDPGDTSDGTSSTPGFSNAPSGDASTSFGGTGGAVDSGALNPFGLDGGAPDAMLPTGFLDAATVAPGGDGGLPTGIASDSGSDGGPPTGVASDSGIDGSLPTAIASDSGTDGGISGDAGVVGGDGGGPVPPPLPSGKAFGDWTWVETPGAVCRDGSPAGYYYRRGSEAPLLIFLNGGGTCNDAFFCSINPKNVDENMPTESLLDATGNLLAGPDQTRQKPEEEGIFKRDARNPVGNWNMIYIPYCTGDVFAGTKNDVAIDGLDGKQQFVGYKNIGLFLESFGPSFAQVGKVLLAGSSAGGIGTLLNYDRVQTFFDKYGARVFAISDSGIPFRDPFLAPCIQKRWRDIWGFDLALPKDCKGCFDADGGGLAQGLGDYLFHEKYKDRKVGGMVSSAEDGIMRAFYGLGADDCTVDSASNTILSAFDLGAYSADEYRMGLSDILDFVGKDRVSTYFLPGSAHMHLWRARYYDEVDGVSMATWLGHVLHEEVTHVGSL